jgi:serine/threonine protein kinase
MGDDSAAILKERYIRGKGVCQTRDLTLVMYARSASKAVSGSDSYVQSTTSCSVWPYIWKQYKPSKAVDRRWKNELHACLKLAAVPRVVRAEAAWAEQDGSGYVIILRRVRGVTLFTLLAEATTTTPWWRWTPASAVQVCSDLAQTLAAIHDRGMIHGDVKAENIMVTPPGFDRRYEVTLIDLEHTHTVHEGLNTLPYQAGTKEYLAPECTGRSGYGYHSDVYALGIVAIELWTNELLYSDCDMTAANSIEHASDCPAELRALLQSMIDPSWMARPTMRECATRLNLMDRDMDPQRLPKLYEPRWSYTG